MAEFDLAKRRKTFGWCLHGASLTVLVLSAGAVYGLVLRPLDGRVSECRQDIDHYQSLLDKGAEVRAEHDRLAKALSAIQDKAVSIQKRIPDESSEAEFLSQVAGAAGQVGLQIRDYRPGVTSVKPAYSQMEIQLSGQGTYKSLCRFLDRLASLPRLTHVVNLDVGAAQGDEYPITVTLVVFFHMTQAPDGKPASEPKPAEKTHA
jgi:Tfp pilus assembly protein PilO